MLWLTVRQLKSPQSAQRIDAAARLGVSGRAAAVGPLVAALGDAVPAVRLAVISALCKLRDASAIGALLALRSDLDPLVRAAVIGALGEIGGASVVEAIIAGISDSHYDVRAASARAAGRVADRRAVASLANLLATRRDRNDPAAGLAAVTALGSIGGHQAIGALAATLRDCDEEVRGAAAAALAALGWVPPDDTERAWFAVASRHWDEAVSCGPAAVPALLSAAAYWSTGGRDPSAPYICTALKRIGSAAAQPIGSVILRHAEGVYVGTAYGYRPLVRLLGEIGDPSAVEPLLAAAANSWLTEAAFGALRLLLARPAVARLSEVDLRAIASELRDVLFTSECDDDQTYYTGTLPGSSLKAAARKELGRRGDAVEWQRWVDGVLETAGVERHREQLSAALKHDQDEVREASVIALGEIGTPEVAGPLADALSDAAPDVRRAAAEALARLGPTAIEALAAALGHEFKRARVAAIRVLGRIDDPRVAGLLAPALHDSSKDVREAAAQTLNRLDGTAASEAASPVD